MTASSHRLFFLYHELRTATSSYSYVMERRAFEQHLDLFERARSLENNTFWPEITFDDGHLSNYEIALPALAARQMDATFFLTVGWTGTRSGYMDWSQVRALHRAGQRIGAHGWSHTLLTHCDDITLRAELEKPRFMLEEKLGAPITSMSLPGGRFDSRVLDSCRAAGYKHVFSSIPHAEPGQLEFLVGRLNLRNTISVDSLNQLLDSRSGALARLERQYKFKAALKRSLGDRLYAKLWSTLNRQEPETEASTSEGPLP